MKDTRFLTIYRSGGPPPPNGVTAVALAPDLSSGNSNPLAKSLSSWEGENRSIEIDAYQHHMWHPYADGERGTELSSKKGTNPQNSNQPELSPSKGAHVTADLAQLRKPIASPSFRTFYLFSWTREDDRYVGAVRGIAEQVLLTPTFLHSSRALPSPQFFVRIGFSLLLYGCIMIINVLASRGKRSWRSSHHLKAVVFAG